MSLTDKPLPMNQLCVAMVQDLGKVYENNAAHEKSDLNTMWQSMYSKGLHRKVSSQCYFTPEEIEEQARKKEDQNATKNEKDEGEQTKENENDVTKKDGKDKKETTADDDNDDEIFETSRDFASVHLSRAMNSGRAHLHDEGRRYRKRTFSGSGGYPGENHPH